ncbi:RNA polymerase sigma factor (sigma-70 family) [Catalinimonas alkaloidigena]|uniref:RNA polymerase sigma factor n=1 Tax=Catalinimonas alkaloidigena TaxID=1075417 RepID=UPI002404FB76|nr:RNA polymerase sigma factor [Catalinimonas alkaloidigena]MDF9799330.1 RNA polymerase sigma factor (sigma-70 family) [Catalinimonas alkaloidigena]
MKFIKQHIRNSAAKLHAESEGFDLFSDTDLWSELIKGSHNAFEQIYYRYVNLLYDYGFRLSGEPQLVEDCIQDFFTDLWVKRNKLPQVKAVKSYLLVSLKRRLFRKLAHQKKDVLKVYEALEPRMAGFDPDFDVGHAEDSRIALTQALTHLSNKQKEAIYLRFYNLLSYEEIAEVMEVQVKAVYKLMARALKVLRATMNQPIITHLLIAILAS